MVFPPSLHVGINSDYYNELRPLDVKYRMGGLDAVVEHLRNNPVPNYEERRDALLGGCKNNAERARIKKVYAVTKQNADSVRSLDTNVRLLNSAANNGKLTETFYHRFIDRYFY